MIHPISQPDLERSRPVYFRAWPVVMSLTAWIPPLLIVWAVLRWLP